MQVIEAQRASILKPHDHLHISQIRDGARVRVDLIWPPWLATAEESPDLNQADLAQARSTGWHAP